MLVCPQLDWKMLDHKRSHILPPLKVTMLGQQALVPAYPELFLNKGQEILGMVMSDEVRNKIPWMQYDPVPFLLCHMYHPDFIELACKPPVVDIAVAPSIAAGFDTFARQGRPFIVKSVAAFDFNLAAFRARTVAEGLTTFGWDKSLEEVKGISIAAALEDWERNELKVNFVDSPIPKMVPNAGIHADLRAAGINEDNLMLVMSNHGTYTPFHQDPIAGAASGGGWMWLLQGEKMWNFVGFEHSDVLFDETARSIADPTLGDLLYRDNHVLWGKVGQVFAQAGDFVYFPPGCSHRVWTWEGSIGIGGYARFGFDDERVAAAAAWYESKGINPAHGMFQLVTEKKAAAVAAAVAGDPAAAAASPAPSV